LRTTAEVAQDHTSGASSSDSPVTVFRTSCNYTVTSLNFWQQLYKGKEHRHLQAFYTFHCKVLHIMSSTISAMCPASYGIFWLARFEFHVRAWRLVDFPYGTL